MKTYCLAFLMMIQLSAFAQISIQLPRDLVTEKRLKAYVDSALQVKAEPTPIPTPGLEKCQEGPVILNIYDITPNDAWVQFHGINVQGIDFKVENLAGQLVSAGNITPRANRIRIPYVNLSAGSYKLTLSGSSCSGVDSKTFFIPKDQSSVDPVPNPSVPAGKDRFELFMNTTGYGFDPTDPTGINKDWRERIEAHKTDWGYSITGVKLLVRWYDWEPKKGVYTRQGIQDAIKYCSDRGLKFSVYFWPWRLAGDGFIPEGEYCEGDMGTRHTLEGSKYMASLVSPSVNQQIHNAVRELAGEMAKYEGSFYLSIGTANAEEFINPMVDRFDIKRDAKGNEIDRTHIGYEIGGFEGMFQASFKNYLASKGRSYQRPEVVRWGGGPALQMGSEIGKDFARYISLVMKNYFDNFSSAVHEGGKGKILATYTYPDAGSIANAWFLHANFTDQAATADAMYGTDGTTIYNVDRKRLANAVNLGMGKVSIIEYDAEDIGFGVGLPDHCSGFDIGLMEREFNLSYEAGAQVISLAMAFCPDEIRAMEPVLKRLHEKYIGKPYKKPSWPTTEFDMAPAYFGGQDIYAPHWTGSNFLKANTANFWK